MGPSAKASTLGGCFCYMPSLRLAEAEQRSKRSRTYGRKGVCLILYFQGGEPSRGISFCGAVRKRDLNHGKQRDLMPVGEWPWGGKPPQEKKHTKKKKTKHNQTPNKKTRNQKKREKRKNHDNKKPQKSG